MSALQADDLAVYLPPMIQYARDSGGDIELFAILIAISNEGAHSGTVVSIKLDVKRLKDNASKRYYSAYLDEHPRDTTATPAEPNLLDRLAGRTQAHYVPDDLALDLRAAARHAACNDSNGEGLEANQQRRPLTCSEGPPGSAPHVRGR